MPEDKTYTQLSVADLKAESDRFEYCQFVKCDFSNADLSSMAFADCRFTDCNLMLANVAGTAWQNVTFTGSKLSGVHFSRSSNFLFELHFTQCLLDNAVFYQKKNKKAKFTDCSLIETDFTEADLTETIFHNCNLNRAFFSRTILKGTDFRTSYNYTINPEENMIKKAKFSLQGLPGLLSKYDINIYSS